jgi:gliding motility-associated-like protein
VYVLPDSLLYFPEILIDDLCLQEGFYQFTTLLNDTNFSYQWQNQSALNFTTSGGQTQTLSISNACINLKIDTFISACPEQIAFALPTAFSPNNDGINDFFRLLYISPLYNFENIRIYNRWGEEIFNSTDPNFSWNGNYENNGVPLGTYMYQLELIDSSLNHQIHSGNVSVIQ